MSTPTATLYPPEGFGAPKDRRGHAKEGGLIGLPTGTEIFSADNHISVADDIFYETVPRRTQGQGAAHLVRGRRVHGRHQRQVLGGR